MSDTKVICRRSELVAVADATRSKTGRTDEMTLGEIASAITASGGDTDTSDATATADEIFAGETAYTANGKVTGTFTIDNELSTQDNLIEQLQSIADNLPDAGSGEDVTTETNAYTTKLASLETAVAALETELAGKASGGGSGGTNIRTCTVLIQSTNILIRCYSSTNYTNDAGIHVEHNHDLSGYSYTINDVVCGSILTLHTTNPLIPGNSATGGATRLDFAYGGAWMFSIPQEPTGDIVITVRDDD